MKQLSVADRVPQLREGYSGRAVQFDPRYSVAVVKEACLRAISRALCALDGPLYSGELEVLMLNPLMSASARTMGFGSTPSPNSSAALDTFVSLAVNYAIVSQTVQTYELRELAKDMTMTMLQNSPLYRLIQADAGAMEVERAEKIKSDGPLPIGPIGVIRAWVSGTEIDTKTLGETTTSKLADPSSALAILGRLIESSTTASTKGLFQPTNISSLYAQLLEWAGRGKGMALTISERQQFFTRLTSVQIGISEAFRDAESEIDPILQGQKLANAATLSIAFLSYLKMAKEPDSFFPASATQHDVRAWASFIKNEAAKLSQHYLALAMASASYSISQALYLWRSEKDWLNFFGEPFEVLVQSERLLDEAVKKFEPMKSDAMSVLAHAGIDALRDFSGADTILPMSIFEHGVYSQWLDKLANLGDGVFKSERDNMAKSVPSSVLVFSPESKLQMQTSLAIDAGKLQVAIDTALRTTMLFSVDMDSLMTPTLLCDVTSEDISPLKAQAASQCGYLEFAAPSPLSVHMLKYLSQDEQKDLARTLPDVEEEVQSALPTWVLRQYMYKPIYFNQVRAGLAASITPQLMWNNVDVPSVSGDAITQQYGFQPIPAVYTYQRNRSQRPYTMADYLREQRGLVDGVSAANYLANVATLLHTYGADSEMTSRLLIYLSAVMFVYRVGSSSVERLEPKVVALYGVPLKAFEAKQTVPKIDKSETVYERRVRVGDLESAETFIFRLHQQYPAPESATLVVTGTNAGTIQTTPVFDSAIMAARQALQARLKGKSGIWVDSDLEMIGSSEEGGWTLEGALDDVADPKSFRWITAASAGFSPFQRWCPHMYFSVFSAMEQNPIALLQFTLQTIAHRVDPVTGDLQARAFLDNPLAILDREDFDSAESTPDPSVDPSGKGGSPRGIRDFGSEMAHQPATPPQPEVAAQLDKEQKREAVKQVLAGPQPEIVKEGDKVRVVDMNNLPGAPVDTNIPQSVVAGDPNHVVPESPAPDAAPMVWVKDPKAQELKLKKVKQDEVPDGWVLASEEEIKKWLEGGHEG